MQPYEADEPEPQQVRVISAASQSGTESPKCLKNIETMILKLFQILHTMNRNTVGSKWTIEISSVSWNYFLQPR